MFKGRDRRDCIFLQANEMRDDRECDVCDLAYVYLCVYAFVRLRVCVFVRMRMGPIASLVVEPGY